ncbi:MAG: fructosamine kinase family protein [Alcanivorax sp.]|nr:fructosamine kinase family protein [Alcanivorax sp.]
MLNLFGHPPQAFYEGYPGGMPDSRQRRAWPVYDLYHWLNHFNLFGGHYQQAVAGTLTHLLP